MQNAIIVDIDNTLVSQAKRIVYIYNQITGENVECSSYLLKKPIELIKRLTESQYKLFYSIFLSGSCYDKDHSFCVDVINGAAEALNKIRAMGIKIVFLTARIENSISPQKEITQNMLEFFELTKKEYCEELILMENDFIPDNSQDFHKIAMPFKLKAVGNLSQIHNVIFAIGDSSSDIDAYKKSLVYTVQAGFILPTDRISQQADKVVYSWDEVVELAALKINSF